MKEVFVIEDEEVQYFACKLLGRYLTEEEFSMVQKGIGTGLRDYLEDVFETAIEEAVCRKQICSECGESVARGSGKFVDRIPDWDRFRERKENGRPFPEGEWVCVECYVKVR